MDKQTIRAASSMAADVVGETLEQMRESFGVKDTQDRRRMTPREQVDLYLRMSEKDLERIKQQRGDREFHRYLARMNSLMEEV